MKKDFIVSEVIVGITGYRSLSGDNLDYFQEGTALTDIETLGVETRYYVKYKGETVLHDVNELEVTNFFESGEYKEVVDNWG